MTTNRPFRSSERRTKILNDFNQSALDPVRPVGGDKGMAVLNEMNDLEAGLDEFVKSLTPRLDLL